MRVLIISNNSFSQTSSNGRTLANYFNGYPKENLAQFCISTTTPDYSVCDNYYIITDKEAFESCIHLRKARRCDISKCENTEANSQIVGNKRSFKTATKALARHFVWKHVWSSREFWAWVEAFSPDVVLVMNSDSAFILDIARVVSERQNIPLVMYNTEGFYFFKKDYMRQELFIDKLAFPIYHYLYKKSFRKMMKTVRASIHLNDKLANDFRDEFGGVHNTIYSASNFLPSSTELNLEKPVFCYLGNFGFNRPDALIEIANVLAEIDSSYKLHIYGNILETRIVEKFKSVPNIVVEGFVEYSKVKEVMYGSTILFHAESQIEKFKESLKYGFTTKIADSLCCGIPFLMYSSKDIAGADYIRMAGAAWFADNVNDLKKCILEILRNNDRRNEILDRARQVALENHNDIKNKEKFITILRNVIDEGEPNKSPR